MLSKRLATEDDSSLVQAHLEGLCASAPHVRLLDGFPQIKVAFDAARDQKCVALLAGGGSGHEPAFAGFVGKGMLSAAVCGDLYAAPSADAVLAAIQTVTTDAGCLLLPINYTGDRLNFGLAAEGARARGLQVETVLVDEDCAVQDVGTVGRRGLAGAVLVIKLVGAQAQRGMPLRELAKFAQGVVKNLGTIGVGLDTCSLPGQPATASRLGDSEIELGLGIHGEAGAQKIHDLKMESVIDRMLQSIMHYDPCPFESGASVGVLVNNLGGVAVMDLNIAIRRILQTLETECRLQPSFVISGMFVTSITVAGFSITLLKMESEYLELMNAPTNAVGWTVGTVVPRQVHAKVPLPSADEEAGVQSEELSAPGALLRRCIEAVTQCLLEKEDELNAWDATVGDGDCGSTLAKACKTIQADIESYPLYKVHSTLRKLSQSISRSSGGTSGALYSIFLTTASVVMAIAEEQMSEMEKWVVAFEKGLEAIKRYGRSSVGDRTMLDALDPACAALRESIGRNASLVEAVGEMREAAKKGADSTIGMLARVGRSSYIPVEHFQTTPDPGAKAVEFWIKAIADILS